MNKLGLFRKNKVDNSTVYGDYNSQSISPNKDEDETLTDQKDSDNLDVREPYVDANLESLKLKDMEMYIEFFGSDEEKENLKQEKVIAANKIKDEEIKKKQHLYAVLNSEYYVLIEELSKEIKTVYSKSPETIELYSSEMLAKLEKAHLQLTNELEYIIKTKETLDIEEINVLRKKLNEYQISDTDTIFKYFSDCIAHLENRAYPPETILKMENALREIVSFSEDYMESVLVQDDYKISIELDYLGLSSNDTWNITFTNQKTHDNKYVRSININFINIYTTAISLIENGNNQHMYDAFLVQNLLRQWNDYKNYPSEEVIKGLKNRFIDESKIYRLDENLRDWVV